ncbi:type II toxin-antitoxin system HicA family toxin [Psychrobacter sp. FME5]|uniref:type II toxin-antitoxin system HicA family toxin n=1 Tax=unclassified Psychrobacter TaxID=196806 RepID=UPI0017883987|nr:type II toxin-antitoxin system HicA family toxin [Psychrobacter sp. FME5]MBE0443755.1 type II toxin-antitoxin system HicA family toxin [Psychrobacter sp. FME5]
MKSGELIKLLKEDGWIVDRVKGSHHILRKEGVDSIISISHPEKDVSRHQLAQARRISSLKL